MKTKSLRTLTTTTAIRIARIGKQSRSDPGDPLANDPLRLGIEWEYNSQDAVEDAHRLTSCHMRFAERDRFS